MDPQPAACSLQPSVMAVAITEDIRDIHGLIHIPYPWSWILWLLLAATVVYLMFWAFKKWEKKRHTVVPKFPHEIALERLEKARALLRPGQAREFSIAVSDAVRLYIEDRFHEKAARRTTEEFFHDLLLPNGKTSGLLPHASLLESFLQHCDLAKFGRWSLSIPEMEAMHDSARKFVSETQPVSGERSAVSG